MAAILRESGAEDVEIETEGRSAKLRTAGASFKVVGIDPADFPAIPVFDGASALRVPAVALVEMIRRTRFAASTEVVHYVLTGQLLDVRAGEIRMVASDGRRLAYAKAPRSPADGRAGDVRAVVPTKAMDLLARALEDGDAHVDLDVDETQVRMRTARAMVFSRLIEGQFPDYEAVVPAGLDKRVSAEHGALASAVRRAALMTSAGSRAVKFTVAPGRMTLLARTPDVGEATVGLPVGYEGEEFDVVLNPDYIEDYLRAVPGGRVEARFKDRASACVLSAGDDYVYVVMPLTVSL
jgi:DNA polymerase-3 subunit beta